MVHYIALYKLRADVTDDQLEMIIRTSRSKLLKIPEVLTLRSGKRIEADSEWPFFIAIDFESLDKMVHYLVHPIYIRFKNEVLRQWTTQRLELRYETDPGKNTKYS
jgi:hypothetical protein